jgi:dTDP-glucose 4,6-dehydratase
LEDCVRTLSNISTNFKAGEVYNIGSEEYHDIERLAELAWKFSGADPKLIRYEESEVLTTKSKKVDVSKSVRDLQHKNTVSLEDGVRSTVQWMKEYYAIK